MNKELKLISMSDIQAEAVRWLWYPYLPAGKITNINGDPGEGKTTVALAVTAALSRGTLLPGQVQAAPPMNVIYQTAEDGLADTVKPRLEMLGADCSRVLVIDESQQELTLLDQRLEQAIMATEAGLLVIDPIQAYLGGDVDMHRANEVRPILKRVGALAEATGCAVLLIGHMNKSQGQKAGYRQLGSIDFRAAARSVLVVGRMRDDPCRRVMVQDKNSLAPEGSALAFGLGDEDGFRWQGFCDTGVDELLEGKAESATKTELMEQELAAMLQQPLPAEEVQQRAKALGVSLRTLMIAKKNLGVTSERADGRWLWRLPDEVTEEASADIQGCKDVSS